MEGRTCPFSGQDSPLPTQMGPKKELCCAVLSHPEVFNSFVTPWTARLLCPWNSPDKNIGVSYHVLLLGIFPTQGSNPVSFIAVDSLLFEPPGKLKNVGMGSLSLLQGNFPTQELNWGLLNYRRNYS